MSAFTESVEHNLHGVEFFSVGACPGCDECGLAEYGDAESRESRHYETAREGADEGHFSWSPCDSCGSRLGGNRYPAHGYISGLTSAQGERTHAHFNVCVDCLQYHANGTEPDKSS